MRGLGANVYGQVIIVVVQLVGVPVLLHAWGSQLYGEWLILFAIPSFLSITDLGFSQSAANDMSQKVAREERTEAVQVFQSLCAIVFACALAALLLVTAVVLAFPLARWMHFKSL